MNLINDYIEGWRYYNHALIPTCAPDEKPLIESLNSNIWFHGKKPLFARWTYDFDCKKETNFWYLIKDTPFDINELTSHYRNQIKKGFKYFDFKKIDPKEYEDSLIEVQKEAFKGYEKSAIIKYDDRSYDDCDYFGVFYKDTNELCGYIITYVKNRCIQFDQMRTDPNYEKLGISEAMVYGLLEYYKNDLKNGMYINDGTRSVLHETKFQDYLIKKYHFRKAYCKLNIKYNPIFKIAVYLLYPFRRIIRNNKIKAILLMQEISISDK